METKTIKLKSAIKFGDKTISELEIKEPTAGQIMNIGFPVDGKGQIDMPKAGALLEACTGVQLPALQLMSGKDFMLAIAEMVKFLGDADEETAGN